MFQTHTKSTRALLSVALNMKFSSLVLISNLNLIKCLILDERALLKRQLTAICAIIHDGMREFFTPFYEI